MSSAISASTLVAEFGRRHQKYPSCFFFSMLAACIVVDRAALAFDGGGQQHFLDHRARASPPRSRPRRSADSSPACGSGSSASTGTSPGSQPEAIVIDHQQQPVALHRRARRGEIERHDLDLLELDILPDVELGPVARAGTRGCSRPWPCGHCRAATARAAGSWGPSGGWRCGTRRCAPWRGSSPRRAARRRTPRRSRAGRAPASALRSSTYRCGSAP